MSCQQVPTAPAFNPYPRSVQVGEFEVAIGGGIWVAIGGMTHDGAKLVLHGVSDSSVSILEHHPSASTEIYSFFRKRRPI